MVDFSQGLVSFTVHQGEARKPEPQPMAFVIPKAAPYVVPVQQPHKPKDTQKVESVKAVVGAHETAKGYENDAATVHISEQARQLARRGLAKEDDVA
jgi:hypothetical protein